MDKYKKKTLKFVHEKISRDFRHAETLKARESSRFKRLSMIRSMADSMEVTSNDSVEIATENVDICQQTRNGQKSSKKIAKNPSRLDMLQKWKQEKLMKSELEKRMQKKPFYAGSSSGKQLPLQFRNPTLESSQNLKSSFINQSKIRFNASRTVSNKVLPKPASFQPAKAPSNSKLVAPNSLLSSRIPNTKLPGVANSGSNNSKATSIPTFGKKENSTAAKPAIIASNKLSSARPMIGGIKPPLSKTTPTAGLKPSKQNESSASKVTSQGLSIPRSAASRPLGKPIQKVDSISKAVSAIPAKFSKGIPVRPPKQTPTMCTNTSTNASKAPNKSASKGIQSQQNVTLRKRFPDKIPAASVKQKQSAFKINEANDGKVSSDSPVDETSVESASDMLLLRTPDFNQIKKIIDAKLKELQQEKQDEDNERSPSSSVEGPVINEDLCESVVSKSFEKEDADVQIRNDSLKSTVVEGSMSAQCDISEVNDVKESSCSPVIEIRIKSQSDDLLISLLGTPDIKQIKQVIETKMKSPKLEQEIQDRANMMNMSKHDLSKMPETIEFKEEITSVKGELLSGQSLENIPDLSLNCDLSIIKREASFAPHGFKFQPPVGLSAFLFDDVCEAIENRNLKFMSRTSTPTREACERASDNCSKTRKSTDKDCPLINKKDSPQKVSNDLANEIITDADNPFKMVLQNEELLISETSDILINNETFEEEELITKEDLCEKSPRKFEKKEDLQEKLNVEPDINKANDEKVSSEDSVNEMSTNKQSEEFAISLPESPNIDQIKQVIESQMQSMKLKQEKQNGGDLSTEKEISKKNGKKSTGAISKRVSVHRKSVLHSIAETSEADESVLKSQNSPCTPRRSLRLSAQKSQVFGDHSKSTIKSEPVLITPVAPTRRSQRLLQFIPKSCQFDDVLSPFKGKKSSHFNLNARRSVRLIDFSMDDSEIVDTHEKSESAKTNITADFEKLALNADENMDPNACLIDFENSPEPVLTVKSRKVSLLYSPEKRKSIRKSIRGDLISFSPNSN